MNRLKERPKESFGDGYDRVDLDEDRFRKFLGATGCYSASIHAFPGQSSRLLSATPRVSFRLQYRQVS